MKVRWTEPALQDRHNVVDHIAENDPGAAERLDIRFVEAVQRLAIFPNMGRPGSLIHTREWIPHPSYRIVYEVDDDTIIVHAIVHTRRQWPPVSED